MSRSTYLLFLGYTLLSVAGLLILRSQAASALSAVRTGHVMAIAVLLAALGALAYILGFGLWVLILARVPLVSAYPTAVGLTLAGTTLSSALILHEEIGVRAAVGCCAVFIGVCLLSTG